jgi:hypothetical protein
MFALVAPEIKLGADEIIEGAFQGKHEGATVKLKECERYRKPPHGKNEWASYDERQYSINDISTAETPQNIDKLAKCEGAEYLVFDLDELRDLELHRKTPYPTPGKVFL